MGRFALIWSRPRADLVALGPISALIWSRCRADLVAQSALIWSRSYIKNRNTQKYLTESSSLKNLTESQKKAFGDFLINFLKEKGRAASHSKPTAHRLPHTPPGSDLGYEVGSFAPRARKSFCGLPVAFGGTQNAIPMGWRPNPLRSSASQPVP